MPSRPLVIGLVGGIASGKSTVARAMERRGARVIDADRLAKDLLDLPEVRRELRAAFGDVESNGKIDTARLAAAAFGSADSASRLNAIVHPYVTAATDLAIEEWRSQGFQDPVVLDAALLLEAGMQSRADLLVFVNTPDAERRRRAASRGWDENEITKREALQWSLDRKRAACSRVIENGGGEEAVDRQVEQLWQQDVERSATT